MLKEDTSITSNKSIFDIVFTVPSDSCTLTFDAVVEVRLPVIFSLLAKVVCPYVILDTNNNNNNNFFIFI